MNWKIGFRAFCLVLTAVVVKTQSDDLKFCQADLKGYVFQNTDTERCFEFVYKLEDRLTWSDARDYCQVNGGRMINIEDQVKQSVLEFFLNSEKNPYKPDTKTYNPLTTKKETWGDYDPDVWIGAMRDSDGTTWRFDQFSTSRTVGSVIATWFNYGDDPVLLAEQEANRNKYTIDTCLMMRFSYRTLNNTSAEPIKVISYKWYQHQQCSNTQGHRHPFICEYIGYEYRETPSTSNWVIVIGVLGAFVGFGFLACTLYCLWDKIHTSYNVLQV